MKKFQISCFVMLFVLLGCGGEKVSKPELTLSKTQLNFDSRLGEENPPQQSITGTVKNGESLNEVYIILEKPSDAFYDLDVQVQGRSGTISVMVTAADAIGVGTFNSAFNVKVCTDASCRNQIEGSPKTVSLNYTVKNPEIRVVKEASAYSKIAFTTKEGEQYELNRIWYGPSSWPGYGSGFSWDFYDKSKFTITYQGETNNWLQVEKQTNEPSYFTLKTIKNLSPGTYNANLLIETDYAEFESISLPIEYRVTENTINVSSKNVFFDLDGFDSEDELNQSVSIAYESNSDLEVTYAPDWLTVTKTDALLELSVNNKVAKLKNGTEYDVVKINSASDQSTFYNLAVKLNLDAVQFDYVLPYYQYTDQAPLKLTVYGEKFDSLAGSPIFFGETAVDSYLVIDDNTIEVKTPTNVVGYHNIFTNKLFSKADLAVIEPEEFAQTTISPPDRFEFYSFIYEPAYQRMILKSHYDVRIVEYKKSSWSNIDFPRFDKHSITQANFSVDGKGVYMHYEPNIVGATSKLVYVDFDTLQLTQISENIDFYNKSNFTAVSDTTLFYVDDYWKDDFNFYNFADHKVNTISTQDDGQIIDVKISQDRSVIELLLNNRSSDYVVASINKNGSYTIQANGQTQAISSDNRIKVIGIDYNVELEGQHMFSLPSLRTAYFNRHNNIIGLSRDRISIYDLSRLEIDGSYTSRTTGSGASKLSRTFFPVGGGRYLVVDETGSFTSIELRVAE